MQLYAPQSLCSMVSAILVYKSFLSYSSVLDQSQSRIDYHQHNFVANTVQLVAITRSRIVQLVAVTRSRTIQLVAVTGSHTVQLVVITCSLVRVACSVTSVYKLSCSCLLVFS